MSEFDPPVPADASVHRVAIYFCPAVGSAAWNAGSRWLGHCAAKNCQMPQPVVEGMDADAFHALTEDPRRYGWHATLKAPFRLHEGCTMAHLESAVQQLAASVVPFDLPPLEVQRLKGFLALRPAQPSKALDAIDTLAARCVTELHALAAPLTATDLARRRQAQLSEAEDALLVAWGYPWVLDRFRFHFSLTGPLKGLPDDAVMAVEAAARQHFNDHLRLPASHLSLFVEPAPGAPFRLWSQYPIGVA